MEALNQALEDQQESVAAVIDSAFVHGVHKYIKTENVVCCTVSGIVTLKCNQIRYFLNYIKGAVGD